jgi:hypothetical protein
MVIALSCSACDITISNKRMPQYKGYIDKTVASRVPLWLYYNDNGQLGRGRGYVLRSYPNYGNDGLIGVLPVGHAVTFSRAYQQHGFESGYAWVEGRTDFKGQGYLVQMDIPREGGTLDTSYLTDSFYPAVDALKPNETKQRQSPPALHGNSHQ